MRTLLRSSSFCSPSYSLSLSDICLDCGLWHSLSDATRARVNTARTTLLVCMHHQRFLMLQTWKVAAPAPAPSSDEAAIGFCTSPNIAMCLCTFCHLHSASGAAALCWPAVPRNTLYVLHRIR